MKTPRVLAALAVAVGLLACGACQDAEPPARGGVSKATDDIPTSKNTGIHVDRFRFGDATDADGIVIHEIDALAPDSPVAISLYLRNAPAGTEVRFVFNDLASNAPAGEEIRKVGDKGFVTLKRTNPLPEGSYRLNTFYRYAGARQWQNLGTKEFRVGKKS